MNADLVGECCEIMKLALERRQENGKGLDISQMINFKTGATSEVMAYHYRKARKGDDGKYGHGKPHANSTWAPVSFCPFCGAKGCRRDATKAEDKEANP